MSRTLLSSTQIPFPLRANPSSSCPECRLLQCSKMPSHPEDCLWPDGSSSPRNRTHPVPPRAACSHDGHAGDLPPGGTPRGAPALLWDQARATLRGSRPASIPHTALQSLPPPHQASQALIPASPLLLSPNFSTIFCGLLGGQHKMPVTSTSLHAAAGPSLSAPASSALCLLPCPLVTCTGHGGC